MTRRRRDICSCCQRDMSLTARTLCTTCWCKAKKNGELDNYGAGKGKVEADAERYAAWIEDVEILMTYTRERAAIAAKLNIQPDTLSRQLQRHGRQDLLAKLISPRGAPRRKA